MLGGGSMKAKPLDADGPGTRCSKPRSLCSVSHVRPSAVDSMIRCRMSRSGLAAAMLHSSDEMIYAVDGDTETAT